jgi:putative transcriptional regulator
LSEVNYMPASIGRSPAADALLASYAAGALAQPLHVLVASHLALKPESRRYVAALESLAGAAMDAEPVFAPVAERGRRLAAIYADGGDIPRPCAKGLAPEPLASFLGRPYEALRWRTVLPGLKEAKIVDDDGCEASMLWIRAGRAMPSHTHHGMEATLVLQGSFSDAHGHYERGDIAIADDEIDHKPIAGSEEDCICFAVSEGPVKLTGPVARLFNKLLKH